MCFQDPILGGYSAATTHDGAIRPKAVLEEATELIRGHAIALDFQALFGVTLIIYVVGTVANDEITQQYLTSPLK
jgi:hypothetical protein